VLDIVAAAVCAGQHENGFAYIDGDQDIVGVAVQQLGFEGEGLGIGAAEQLWLLPLDPGEDRHDDRVGGAGKLPQADLQGVSVGEAGRVRLAGADLPALDIDGEAIRVRFQFRQPAGEMLADAVGFAHA
jgi:hypothetical protein